MRLWKWVTVGLRRWLPWAWVLLWLASATGLRWHLSDLLSPSRLGIVSQGFGGIMVNRTASWLVVSVCEWAGFSFLVASVVSDLGLRLLVPPQGRVQGARERPGAGEAKVLQRALRLLDLLSAGRLAQVFGVSFGIGCGSSWVLAITMAASKLPSDRLATIAAVPTGLSFLPLVVWLLLLAADCEHLLRYVRRLGKLGRAPAAALAAAPVCVIGCLGLYLGWPPIVLRLPPESVVSLVVMLAQTLLPLGALALFVGWIRDAGHPDFPEIRRQMWSLATEVDSVRQGDETPERPGSDPPCRGTGAP